MRAPKGKSNANSMIVNLGSVVLFGAVTGIQQGITKAIQLGSLSMSLLLSLIAFALLAVLGFFAEKYDNDKWVQKLGIIQNSKLATFAIWVKNYGSVAGMAILFIIFILNTPSIEDSHLVKSGNITVNNSHDVVITQNQTGGYAANTMIFGNLPPRHLNATFEAELNYKLQNETKKPILICVIGESQETYNYASEIYRFLSSEGFKTDTCSMEIFGPPVYGIKFAGLDSEGNYQIFVGPQG